MSGIARSGAALLQSIAADDFVRLIDFRYLTSPVIFLQGGGSLRQSGEAGAIHCLTVSMNLKKHHDLNFRRCPAV
jgi:hypothetical protein